MNANDTTVSELTVRRIPFEFPGDIPAHWNAAKPEWSQMVNGASLVMPYLEPYLIKSVRAGLAKIECADLCRVAADYCAQEGQHYRQHKAFNDALIENGYPRLRELEADMASAYARFSETRSLKFHLAYAAGFESMALSVGHWLVENRCALFGGSDTRVASLVLWHFVEEIEHKNAALDVYNAVYGDYWYRIFGLFYASFHVMAISRRAYVSMLKTDGLWRRAASRLRLWAMVGRFLMQTLPHMLRCCAPAHDPRGVADPPWVLDWIAAYRAGDNDRVPMLDTNRLDTVLAA